VYSAQQAPFLYPNPAGANIYQGAVEPSDPTSQQQSQMWQQQQQQQSTLQQHQHVQWDPMTGQWVSMQPLLSLMVPQQQMQMPPFQQMTGPPSMMYSPFPQDMTQQQQQQGYFMPSNAVMIPVGRGKDGRIV
jgi:hypothetical protein